MHPSEPLHTSHPVHPAEPTDPLDRLARKRAGAKLGWYLHATLYVLVNVVLALLSEAHGKHWAIYPPPCPCRSSNHPPRRTSRPPPHGHQQRAQTGLCWQQALCATPSSWPAFAAALPWR